MPGVGADATERREWLKVQQDRLAGDSDTGRWRRGSFPKAQGTARRSDSWNQRHWASRLLHAVGDVVAHSATGIVAACLVLGWAAVGLATSFPDWWETTLYSVTAAVTVVMVFVIQHTNARQTAATQRKLDELIRTSAHADDSVIAIEDAPDEQLQALTELNLADRAEASASR